jgi:hypothetical protein
VNKSQNNQTQNIALFLCNDTYYRMGNVIERQLVNVLSSEQIGNKKAGLIAQSCLIK